MRLRQVAMLAPLGLCALTLASPEATAALALRIALVQGPTSMPVSSLKYDAFSGGSPSESSTLLLWSMGNGIVGRKGGSLALLHDASREYLGWIDEAGQIQAALDAGSLKRDLTGQALQLAFQEVDGAVLYERSGGALVKMSGLVEKAETKVVGDEKGGTGSYSVFTGKPPGTYAQSLLATFGIAVKGQPSRVKLLVGGYDRTAALDGTGKVEKILDKSWSLLVSTPSK